MPRYELRNTSNDALTYVEGDLPLNLMLSQAAGTYRAKAMSAEEATDIVVPTLTGSITEASLTVGETATLTTNAPAGSTYQWNLDATPIGGATSSSYVTAAAGDLTCTITIPGNPQGPLTTAAVTVAPAVSFDPVFLDRVRANSGSGTTVLGFPAITNTSPQAGEKLLVVVTSRATTSGTPTSMTMNGGGAVLADGGLWQNNMSGGVFKFDRPADADLTFELTNGANVFGTDSDIAVYVMPVDFNFVDSGIVGQNVGTTNTVFAASVDVPDGGAVVAKTFYQNTDALTVVSEMTNVDTDEAHNNAFGAVSARVSSRGNLAANATYEVSTTMIRGAGSIPGQLFVASIGPVV